MCNISGLHCVKHDLYCSASTVLLHIAKNAHVHHESRCHLLSDSIFELEKSVGVTLKNEASQAHSEAVLKITSAATVNVCSILRCLSQEPSINQAMIVDETDSFHEVLCAKREGLAIHGH